MGRASLTGAVKQTRAFGSGAVGAAGQHWVRRSATASSCCRSGAGPAQGSEVAARMRPCASSTCTKLSWPLEQRTVDRTRRARLRTIDQRDQSSRLGVQVEVDRPIQLGAKPQVDEQPRARQDHHHRAREHER